MFASPFPQGPFRRRLPVTLVLFSRVRDGARSSRPEDLAFDRVALDAGRVRFCANNTGNEGHDHLWGNTICVTDGTFAQAAANTAIPEVQLLVQGHAQFAMMDNIAFQPGRGNWLIHEDGSSRTTGWTNGLWDCLPDGRRRHAERRVRPRGDDQRPRPGRRGQPGDPAEWTGGVSSR